MRRYAVILGKNILNSFFILHLYLHIPFCRQACHYCDFHFTTNLSNKSALVTSIVQEIALQKDYLQNKTIETIYFGGGTPSLLNQQEFEKIFNAIHQHFSVSGKAEITVEANPDDLSLSKIKEFISLKINRLSIGIQSFNDDYLHFLNRVHTAQESEKCVKLVQDAGIDNISIDLIYGIKPPEYQEEIAHQIWKNDLEKAINLNVPHLSAYCLTIEEKTVFGNRLKKKKIKPVDDDFAATQFETLLTTVENAGFEQYEISNFAQNQQYAQHNSSYWKQEEYLGIGPSAHSYNLLSRQYNIANNAQYQKNIQAGKLPCEIEHLTLTEQANDYLLTTLRTKWGCNLAKLQKIVPINKQWKNQLEIYVEQGFLLEVDDFVFLTKSGKLLADNLIMNLFF